MDRNSRPASYASSGLRNWIRAFAMAACVASAGLALGVTAPSAAVAEAPPSGRSMSVPIAPDAPERYVVKKGDTLWDIARVFLKDPWYWPEIWYVNPSIANPHLIYPGDELYLTYVNGQPRVTVGRAGEVRLSPQVRTEPLANAIRAIPYDLLMKFVGRPQLIEKSEVKNRPYIVGIRHEHIMGSDQNEAYAKGLRDPPAGTRFTIVHIGDELRDPDNGDVLGYIGNYAGTASVIETSGQGHEQITHLGVVDTGREIRQSDKLFPADVQIGQDFVLSAPTNRDLNGQIIAIVNGTNVAGKYQVLAVNRGKRDGLVPGNAVAIFNRGEEVVDYADNGPYAWRWGFATTRNKVQLPKERSGTMLIFRVYDRMSYGMVVESTHVIKKGDFIKHPAFGHRDVGTRDFIGR